MLHKTLAIIITGIAGLYSSYRMGLKAQQDGFSTEDPKMINWQDLKSANPNFEIRPIIDAKILNFIS
jgi:hypothetical protein